MAWETGGGESLRHELQTDFFFSFALCLSMCTLYVYCKYNVTCNYTLWLDFLRYICVS